MADLSLPEGVELLYSQVSTRALLTTTPRLGSCVHYFDCRLSDGRCVDEGLGISLVKRPVINLLTRISLKQQKSIRGATIPQRASIYLQVAITIAIAFEHTYTIMVRQESSNNAVLLKAMPGVSRAIYTPCSNILYYMIT